MKTLVPRQSHPTPSTPPEDLLEFLDFLVRDIQRTDEKTYFLPYHVVDRILDGDRFSPPCLESAGDLDEFSVSVFDQLYCL